MAKPEEINECAFQVSEADFADGKWAINHKDIDWTKAKDMKNFYPGEFVRKQCGEDWVNLPSFYLYMNFIHMHMHD